MSQVYTFCKSGGAKNLTSQTPTPTPTQTTSYSATTSSYKPPINTNSGSGAYSFRREEPKPDTPKPVTFTDDDFPALGGPSTSGTKSIGSWGDSSKAGVIREPFSQQVAVPRKNIPPLFNKVTRTKKVLYDEDDEESDEENVDYTYGSDSENSRDGY